MKSFALAHCDLMQAGAQVSDGAPIQDMLLQHKLTLEIGEAEDGLD